KEELAMYLDQPQHHVHEILNAALWPDHPLGRSLAGTEKTVENIKRTHLLNYRRSKYVASSILIAAAGRLQHNEVVRAVSRFASKFFPGEPPQFLPADSDQGCPRLKLFTKEIEQTQLAIGLRTCSRHDERRYSLRLLNTILGENMSSRLFQVIREDRGLAYSIQSSLGFFDDAGVLTISAGLEAEKLPQVLKLISRELRLLTKTLPSAAELRRARDYVIGQIELSLESTTNQMMWIGEQYLSYGKITPPSELEQRLNEVKASQIRDVAQDFFRTERLNVALVGPLKSEKGLLDWIRL
ncbi:MAG: pitrilysin family protein, partial [Verrucomicrobiota bacterium]